jgi:hypothetical protein
MGILIEFAPFIMFAVCDRFVGPNIGLIAAALVAAALIIRDLVTPGRHLKLLAIGTFALFAGLAAYALLWHVRWSLYGVRLWVDAGLLIVVLLTMAIGRPFTLQYAREQVDPSLWTSPLFVRTNYVITGAWAVAFFILALADWVLLKGFGIPKFFGIAVIVGVLYAAFKFTSWYPERVRAGATKA